MNKDIICPNCKNKMFFCYDEWGYTPAHLHCDNCHINIGATSFQKCIDLLQEYHQPQTYMEYYKNNIQWLMINGKEIINNEMK